MEVRENGDVKDDNKPFSAQVKIKLTNLYEFVHIPLLYMFSISEENLWRLITFNCKTKQIVAQKMLLNISEYYEECFTECNWINQN